MALQKSQIYLLSFSSAVIAANGYYAQPLLAYWADAFHVSQSNAGQVFFCSMLGQALGMIILIPLGDKLKRKRLILFTIGITTVMIILAALSVNITMLKACMLVAGFFSIGPQLMIPMAVDLSLKEEQTHIVGMITAGVLTGVVFARLIGGSITAWINWRLVYALSSGFLIISFIFIQRYIPESQSKFKGSYKEILQSVWKLFRQYGEIRVAIIVSGSAFVLSRMFWATVAFLLAAKPFNMTTDIIGLFGLVTLAGSMSAPLAGKLNKRFTPHKIILFNLGLLSLAFLLLFFFPTRILVIIAGGLLMEGSRQLIQVTMQSQTISLVAEARSRLNMLFISGCFIGAALGAALGLIVWYWDKWQGVCYGAFIVLAIQSLTYVQAWRKKKSAVNS
ncbi:MAG TPA: MFS transporter [Chitinophagaceae bacterium]|nr:MFS transporter [Chitinophagaceae bacterium]